MRVAKTPRLLLAVPFLAVPSLLGQGGCGEDEFLSRPLATGGVAVATAGAGPSGAGADAGAGAGAGAGGGGGAGDGGTAATTLIDDFEDGDLELIVQEGRRGTWFGYDDTTEDGSLVHLATEADALGTGVVLHATGSGFASWGGFVGILNHDGESYTTYDGSAYGGLSFRARVTSGTGNVRFGFADGNTEPVGGVCSTCYDHFGADLVLTGEWQTFAFGWDDLTQVGWGERFAALDPSRLVYLMFQVGDGAELDLYLDDASFLLTDPTPDAGGAGGATGLGGSGGEIPYVPLAPAVERYGQLQVVGTELCDERGEPVQLKGMSSMWLNWENDGYAESREALAWMCDDWGLEVIRAAMGVEEDFGYVDDPEHALAQVNTIVQNAIDLGVYVIVDWHSHHAEQYEAESAAFFAALAETYGEYPNLIWEPYNEPLDLDWSSTLKPYHEAIVAQIRAHDPDNVIVLGTPNWSQDVDAAALDPVAGDHLMYTLHYYACSHTASLRAKADRALAAGLPLFVTEWGATAADGGLNGVVCEDAAQDWQDWMNANGISWAAWKLDDCTPDATCVLTSGAPLEGGWTTEFLYGHGRFVRDRMREE